VRKLFVFSLFLAFFNAQSQTISATKLTEFVNRGFTFTEVFFNNSSTWSVYYDYNTGFERIGEYENVSYKNKSWRTSAYADGYYFYQKLDLYEYSGVGRIVAFQTNSEKKYKDVYRALKTNSVILDNPISITDGISFVYLNKYIWTEKAVYSDYSIDNNQFTIWVYPKEFQSNLVIAEEKKQIDREYNQLISSRYGSYELREFLIKYPTYENSDVVLELLQDALAQEISSKPTIESINQFVLEFPKSKYVSILNTQLLELEVEGYKRLNDFKALESRITNEKRILFKTKFQELYTEMSFDNFKDSVKLLNNIDSRYNYVVENEFRFNESVYSKDFSSILEEAFFKKVQQYSISYMDNALYIDQFLKKYPKSIYIGELNKLKSEILWDKRILNDIDLEVERFDSLNYLRPIQYSRLIASSNAIVQLITSLKMDRNIRANRETLTSFQSKYRQLQAELSFIVERRTKVYPLNDLNAQLAASLKTSFENVVFSNRSNYLNTSFNSDMRIDFDTFGGFKLQNFPTSVAPPKMVVKGINSVVEDLYKGPLTKYSMPVMSYFDAPLKFSNQSVYYEFVYTKNRQITPVSDRKASVPLGYQKSLSNYMQNKGNANFRPGVYRIYNSETVLNNQKTNEMIFDSYHSFAGISAVLPALILPGTGLRLVTGKKQFWVTALFYGLGAASIYNFVEASNSYTNYTNASNQADMDMFYAEYENYLGNSVLYGISAAGVYSINLSVVIFKGLSNTYRTQKYNRIYDGKGYKI